MADPRFIPTPAEWQVGSELVRTMSTAQVVAELERRRAAGKPRQLRIDDVDQEDHDR